MNLEDLRKKSVDKIGEELDELDAAQLRELRALEELEDKPRVTLLERIDEKLAELDAPSSDAAAVAKAAAATAPPAWQNPAYSGPLTGDQAAWRNTNLDPSFRAPATKPVTGGETK